VALSATGVGEFDAVRARLSQKTQPAVRPRVGAPRPVQGERRRQRPERSDGAVLRRLLDDGAAGVEPGGGEPAAHRLAEPAAELEAGTEREGVVVAHRGGADPEAGGEAQVAVPEVVLDLRRDARGAERRQLQREGAVGGIGLAGAGGA
jgi:hypothetical protein